MIQHHLSLRETYYHQPKDQTVISKFVKRVVQSRRAAAHCRRPNVGGWAGVVKHSDAVALQWYVGINTKYDDFFSDGCQASR